MPKIFVSYRRDDDPNGAARVRDGLAAKFGRSNVFMDVDNLLAGQRFDQELAKALDACDVFIAIIGGRWMNELQARNDRGERDYVREEIGAALNRGIVVVPVRVGREGQLPALPRSEDLPEDIRDLVHHQKHDISHERFARDVDDLVSAIRLVRKANAQGARTSRTRSMISWALGCLIGLMAFGSLGAYYAGVPIPGLPSNRATEASKAAAIAAERARIEREKKRFAASNNAARRMGEGTRKPDLAFSVRPGSGRSFQDCTKCPEMVVVPAGSFTMGSPASELHRYSGESQLKVTIAESLAVSRFAITFDEWDVCVADGGCSNETPSDQGWGRGKRPVIDVTWHSAKAYAAWLSRRTGKTYRLLSEAEWEYVARAGTTTPFWWGASISTTQANYDGNYAYAGGAKG
jgi:hypothetical protein